MGNMKAPSEITVDRLSNTRAVGLTFAHAVAKTVGVGVGVGVLALLGGLLVSMGIDWNTFMECVKGSEGTSL